MFTRYSLASLFVIVTFAGLGAGLWSVNRKLTHVSLENVHLKYELSVLRREVGYLEITDEKKIHVIALASLEKLTWRWRIYIPRHDLELHWGFGEISSEGLHTRYAKVGGYLQEGEQVLTCAIRKNAQGEWSLICQSSLHHDTTGVSLPDGCEPWFTERRRRNGAFGYAVSGVSLWQVVRSPSEPLVLLRQREADYGEDVNDVKKEPPAKKRDGLLLWIAPRGRR